MKTIVTKYHGPTNTRGSRITADDGDGNRVSTPYACELDSSENHAEACRQLCEKMGWGGRLQGGCLLRGGVTQAMVWCWIDKSEQLYAKPLKSFTHPVNGN